MTIKSIRDIDPEKLAAAIEADAGQAMPGLRESIREAQQGIYGKVYTPEMLEEIDRKHKRKRQAAYEERRISKGSQRLPGVLLTPDAAQALAVLMQRGAKSKAAAINAALVAAAQEATVAVRHCDPITQVSQK